MRTLTIADNWKDWKFGDTDAVMTFTALDDDKVPDFSNRTLTFKIASTLNNDLEHPKDFAATATGYIQDKNVILKTEDVKQLTPGNYIVELWAMSNDTQKDAVYPSKGFAQFTIEENSMKVSDVTNIPSMTINAFWNAVMQKVRTLTKGAKGDPGKTPKIVIGSVTKLSPDAQPSATLVPLQSDPNTYTLNLQLPQGVQGEQGLQGIPGVGSKGLDGNNGLTPTIDPKTKHWMIGGTDTGVIAEGQAGKDADPSKYVTIVSFNQLRQQVQSNATALAQKAGKFELEDKLAQMSLEPEVFENETALKAKYPNGKPGLMITADTEHKYVYLNNQWEDKGQFVFNDLNPKDKELLYKSSSNNILINPDLIDNAEGWTITSDWVEDPIHSIGKSMAYGCLLAEDPKEEISIYQKGIPVKGKQKLSMGVQVISDNSGTAKMQVIFRDESDSIIENASAGIIFSTIEKRGLQKKLENIKIPDNAVTAAFTISTSSKGLVIICRPQMNFGEKLIPYSILEINNERTDADNVLANPDLINDAEGWAITSGWVEDPTHSIGKSMAYGCTRDENSTEETSIYQKDISVINRTVLSAAVEVITTSNDCHAGLQILFRNSQGEILADDIHLLAFPHTLNGFEKFKLENIKIPDNAVTAAFTVTFTGAGVVIICRPQIVFNEKVIPYSLSEITTEQQNKANSVLPQFNIGISGGGIGDKWVKSSFSFQQNGQEIKGFVQIAIQGDSSRNHDKKNYKIKVFSDENCKQKLKLRLMPSWPKTNKFNLKANFIDATQSRNLASAKLVAAATAVTPIADPTVESNLAKTSNFGQMEGFPIEVWLNGVYNGLYTCNTKKDDKVFGLDADKAGNAAVSVLDNVSAPGSQLLAVPTAKLDNVAYADELHDTPDPELVANWSKWLEFLNNSSDEDFKNELPSYIDVKSAINVYLFGILSREYDYNTKSVLYLTWNNGKYFYLVPYDLDSNWGQSASGQIEGNPTDDTNWGFATENSTKVDGKFVSNANWSKLFERLYKLFMPEIKEQYTYLRSNVWRTDQLLNAYRDFMNQIPQSVYEKDQKLWPQIPSVETNTYEQLHQVIVQRSNQMDKWIKSK